MLVLNPRMLAAVVRDRRHKQKQSQQALSEIVGLKQSTVSAFETNAESTKLDTLFRILSAAGLEMHIVPKGKTLSTEADEWKEPW